jgi:hypothetical protein
VLYERIFQIAGRFGDTHRVIKRALALGIVHPDSGAPPVKARSR